MIYFDILAKVQAYHLEGTVAIPTLKRLDEYTSTSWNMLFNTMMHVEPDLL